MFVSNWDIGGSIMDQHGDTHRGKKLFLITNNFNTGFKIIIYKIKATTPNLMIKYINSVLSKYLTHTVKK